MSKRTQTQQITSMKPSYLVQRLKAPRKVDNPFSFGGGLRNGGLSDDAMSLLRGIFSFDYMGAAEFEFGAVPEALQGLASDQGQLTAFAISIPLAQVPPNWRSKDKSVPEGAADLFVICRHGHANEVVGRIQEWSAEEFPRLKESLRLTSALRPTEDWDTEVRGWLELNNGFLFFTDREMWKRTCDLFGVVTDASEVTA